MTTKKKTSYLLICRRVLAPTMVVVSSLVLFILRGVYCFSYCTTRWVMDRLLDSGTSFSRLIAKRPHDCLTLLCWLLYACMCSQLLVKFEKRYHRSWKNRMIRLFYFIRQWIYLLLYTVSCCECPSV